MKNLFLVVFSLISLHSLAQNTIALGEDSSPNATLSDVEWIQGHWRGEAFGGKIEEIWSPPLGGSMMGSFKMVMKDEVSFYELMHIQENEGTLLLQIRHFNQDFTGWETQNESVDFALVKMDKNHLYFDGLTFEKISKDQMNVHVLVSEKGEEPKEATFRYNRFR